MTILIPEHVQKLHPYVAGKPIEELARERGIKRIVKLASNENPLGCSPKALAAVIDSLKQAYRYVDPSAYELVRAIAKQCDVRPEQVICGAGTDSLLANIISAFTTRDDEVLTAEGTFIGLYVNTRKLNRKLRMIPLRDYRFDLTAIADAIGSQTKIIYLANPNNPTGNIVTDSELEAFLERVPKSVLVIIDEAYYNYAAHNAEYPRSLSRLFENIIITRTFSKDYGLAGLRVGFAIGPEELISEIYKVRLPFEPNYAAQQAAIAALNDSAFLERTLDLNRRMMTLMSQRFEKLGISYVGGQANFYLLLFPNEKQAVSFNSACLDHGLIVRYVKPFGLDAGVRINTGTEEETIFALDVIEKVIVESQHNSPRNSSTEQIKG